MSVVPVYSIAKTYTAAAALLSFDLDDQVGAHVAGLAPDVARLLFRDVLAHRSGLNDYGAWADYREAVERREQPWPDESVIARAEVGKPGEFRYSNIGYLLIRRALENSHASTFFDVLSRLVFTPLGIVAQPFATRDDWDRCDHPAIDDSLRAYHPGWVYPGTFAAEPDEVARGIALLMQGRLGDALADRMRATLPVVGVPDVHPMAPGAGYGLGLMTKGDPATVVGHGGGGPGFSLFATASADGSRWRGEAVASDVEDLEVIRRCVEAVAD